MRIDANLFAIFVVFILHLNPTICQEVIEDEEESKAPPGTQQIFFSPDQIIMSGGPDPDKEPSHTEKAPNLPPEKIPKPHEENGVTVLVDANFDSFIANNSLVFVEFYSPSCPHCLDFAPIFDEIASDMKDYEPKIIFAKVNAQAERYVSQSHVNAFPSLKLFVNGEGFIYDRKNRKKSEVIDYLKKETDPATPREPNRIIKLSNETFQSTITENFYMMVEFYTPWCTHCKRFQPEVDKAARKLYKNKPSVYIASVNCDDMKGICDTYKVQSYPTMKIFRNGKESLDYKGKRTADDIVKYMLENYNIRLKNLTTKTELKNLHEPSKNFMLGSFSGIDDSLYNAFEEAAYNLRATYGSAAIFDPKLQQELNLETNTFYILPASNYHHSSYESDRTQYTGEVKEASVEKITEFMNEHHLPLLGDYNELTEEKYDNIKKETPICFFFFSADYSPEMRSSTQHWRNKIIKLAHEFKGRITMATADDMRYNIMFKNYDLEESSEEFNVGCNVKQKRFALLPPMEEFDEDVLRKFLSGVLDGSSYRVFQSQMVPYENDEPVKIIVARSFVDMVEKDETKDVVIFFVSDTCKKCKKFLPYFEELAAELESVEPNLVFGKFDCSKNIHRDPPYSMRGFPTIYISPAFRKSSPIRYTGALSKDDLQEFIEDYGRNSFQKKQKQEL